MSRMLELNDVQSGVMDIAFKLADDQGLLLLDLDDLRALLNFVTENKAEIGKQYGLVSPQSVAAIQRALLRLEQDGGEQFFGEPALQLADLMRQDMSGRGVINLLSAEQLILRPRLYSSFLLWLLSELFETLPEVGDLDVPKLVFFFDEAHLLFDDCPPALQQRVEQVVRLIRSKGVGVYFCSQNPDDIPDTVLGQLGNRVQHALRAYTPRDQKAVRTAAETFVQNPKLDVAKVIGELGVGEALVSMLLDKGIPMPVERALIAPPRCRMGAITPEERAAARGRSPVGGKYDTSVNRESAFEMLAERAEKARAPAPQAGKDAPAAGKDAPAAGKAAEPAPSKLDEFLWGTKRRQGAVETAAKSATRTVANGLGRQLLRGILGSLLGGKKG
jgi:DNA helicase HerA-like ATPase